MSPLKNLHIALLHWPIRNKKGATIATATTSLDVHDIARLAKTYDIGAYWIVQPLDNQRGMIQRIVAHWVEGPGAEVHPNRPDALRDIRVVESLVDVAAEVDKPVWVTTSAQRTGETISVNDLAAQMTAQPQATFVLCFGTGWGLAPQVLAASDAVLDPIEPSPYNHLSVRSAVSIYIDRLWMALQS